MKHSDKIANLEERLSKLETLVLIMGVGIILLLLSLVFLNPINLS